MKKDKAPDPDELPVEILKRIDEDSIHILVKLYNMISVLRTIPQDVEMLFILLCYYFKKINARKQNKVEMDITNIQFRI